MRHTVLHCTLATGARQLVVHDALDTTSISAVYLLWLTPMTNIGASPEGALMTTCGRTVVRRIHRHTPFEARVRCCCLLNENRSDPCTVASTFRPGRLMWTLSVGSGQLPQIRYTEIKDKKSQILPRRINTDATYKMYI